MGMKEKSSMPEAKKKHLPPAQFITTQILAVSLSFCHRLLRHGIHVGRVRSF
jgi:hypothetical protein